MSDNACGKPMGGGGFAASTSGAIPYFLRLGAGFPLTALPNNAQLTPRCRNTQDKKLTVYCKKTGPHRVKRETLIVTPLDTHPTAAYIASMSTDGWTIFNESKTKAIYVDDSGELQVSFDNMETWETIGKLSDPTSGVRILMEILGCEKMPPCH